MSHKPRKFGVLLAIAASVWGLLLLSSPRTDAQREPTTAGTENSAAFTPAHSTLMEAVREFFSVHREPIQPIAYTHKVHLANNMQCTDCHVSVEKGPVASIPGVQVCMTCHQMVASEKPEIKKLAAYLERGEDIPWQRVYDYPPSAHVKFNHAPHIRAAVECKTCHGDMTQRTVAIRTVNMAMGFCLDCHKQRRASIDCIACHY